MEFGQKSCKPCEGKVKPIDKAQAKDWLKEILGWQLSDDHKFIYKKYSFKGFYGVMSFVNAVAYIVQKEGHHPDISLGYNYCHISFTTHAIDGLSENDFICAAKINKL